MGGVARRTRLRELLDGSFAGFGKGDDGVEVNVKLEVATVLAVLQDGARDILLSGIVFKNFKTKGSRAKDSVLSVVVEVHDIENERLVK